MDGQILMNQTGHQGDAMLVEPIAKELASHANPCETGRSQDIKIQVVRVRSRGKGRR